MTRPVSIHKHTLARAAQAREALGNSMAVNVMQWIGERIQMMEELAPEIDAAMAEQWGKGACDG